MARGGGIRGRNKNNEKRDEYAEKEEKREGIKKRGVNSVQRKE